VNITQNELLEAVREAMRADDSTDGFTVLEMCDALGLNHRLVRKAVKRMLDSGTAEVVRVRRTRMDGISHTISGYRLKAAV
jgi:transcription initiation factor IIE alpha subunit